MMTARARTHASPGVTAARKHIPPVAGQTRLPWWAAVLPVLAFAMLLGLLLGGGEASAAQQQAAGGDLLAQILERVEQALL
ncbi:MAG TPA: hypothetical protein VGO89_22405, partial [Streptomyces sp.]|nr:hypothetical protein [Streptomyces sp.]